MASTSRACWDDAVALRRHFREAERLSIAQIVATRRYIDEQAVWALMRFSDEPDERLPSRQITRLWRDDARGFSGIEKGEFDRGLGRIIDGAGDLDSGD